MDLDKEEIQAIIVLALIVAVIVLAVTGKGQGVMKYIVGALISKLGLKEGYSLVKERV